MIIGFEETLYIVDESTGIARLSVVVLEGADALINGIIENVQIQLITEDGTALGLNL